MGLCTLISIPKETLAIEECVGSSISYVIDNTNPQIIDRQRYITVAKSHGYEVIGIFFQSKVKDCIERNDLRDKGGPRHAVASTSGKLQMPSYDEGFDQLFFARIVDNGFEITKWKE